MTSAKLELHVKRQYASGEIVEMTIWRLPQASLERPHGLKYSLYYGRNGERIVGYDNERGKGDHRHILDVEEMYTFSTKENLIADFMKSVEEVGGLK
jgi:Family of unknown function (DUF6516)